MADIDEILRVATKRNASDVHIQVGLPPVLRILTRLVPLQSDKLSAEAVEQLILPMMSEAQRTLFHERLEFDFSYDVPGVSRFRVNVFRERDSLAAAMRRFPHDVPTQIGRASCRERV